MSPYTNADALGRIDVEWSGKERLNKAKEFMHYRELLVQKPVIGGYYLPSAFTVLELIPTVSDDEGCRRSKFYPGDCVQIRMEKLEGIMLVDVNGHSVSKDWVMCY